MLLRGELFKSGEGSSAYKLRWFELLGRELRWAESEGTPVKGSIDLRGARVYLDLEEQLGNDDRFGMRIVPRAGPRVYALQASSAEERRLWVEAIDLAAQPDLARSSASSRRHVQLKKPALNEPVGIEVTCKSGVPCVVVDVVSGKAAVEAGLLAGDIIVTIGDTVARSAALAWRLFKAASPGDTLSLGLATWNRAIKVGKREGKLGLTYVAASPGPGFVLSSVAAGGAADTAGLHVGDRILAVQDDARISTPEEFAEKVRSVPEVSFVLNGITTAHDLRKDTQGMLGLKCLLGSAVGVIPAAVYRVQGGLISDVQPRSPARDAGLREGDIIVSVEGHLVSSGEEVIQHIGACSRSVQIVVWRCRPDPPEAPSRVQIPPTPSTGGHKGNGSSSSIGGRQWYYTADVRDGNMPVPQTAYEDLTIL